jgi:hypothetical protein
MTNKIVAIKLELLGFNLLDKLHSNIYDPSSFPSLIASSTSTIFQLHHVIPISKPTPLLKLLPSTYPTIYPTV